MKSSILLATLLVSSNCIWSAQRYSATGLVLKVDPPRRTILVSCESIPGYMDAMTMFFSARDPKTLTRLEPGLMVDFTLVVSGKSSYAEGIHVRDFENMEQQALAARRLRMIADLDADEPSGASVLKVGTRVPSVVLMDQKRNEVDLAGFAGKVVLMNFMYTHCPLPDYCFRLSNNLGNVQRRFQAQMGSDLILLSVTFDPVKDQPEVLANYARTWKADVNWHFLTGALPEVRRVCKMFGVDFWPDEAELLHSLHTVIINRQGRLAANLEGNQYTARQLGDLVQTILDESR
ncbi:MAG TPA: SCO family protein [Terriglobales bacterium]|nr:SCO family protein [Terriglobales bacterium]